MSRLIQLAYISTEAYHLPKTEIKSILEKAIMNNKAKGITGMLIYYNGTFLQVLEGFMPAVLDLCENIKLDKRHKNVTVLYQEEIIDPIFSSWSMGFVDIEEIFKSGDKDFIKYFSEDLQQGGNFNENLIKKVKKVIDKFKSGSWRNYIN